MQAAVILNDDQLRMFWAALTNLRDDYENDPEGVDEHSFTVDEINVGIEALANALVIAP